MKFKNAAILLLSGVVLGILTGLLIAPDDGATTRKKWMKKAKRYKKEIEDKAYSIKEKATDIKDNLEGTLHDVKKRFS